MGTKYRVDETYETNEGFLVKVIDYVDRHNVLIKFLEHDDLQLWVTMQNLKKGEIKNPLLRTVYNRGYCGIGCYTSRIYGEKTQQYIKWFSMFNRCYSEKYQEKQPSYVGCEVSEDFWNFQNFGKWFDKKYYECRYPLELDKDLLFEGNKIYSPKNCCFIPKEINTLINNKRNDIKTMAYLYDKYKNDVPYYIREKLFELTKERKSM